MEHDVTASKLPFLSLLPRECMSRFFFENFFHLCEATFIPVHTKVHFKKLQFLETEMTWSQPIIVRECSFKNQNLRFAPR